MWERRREKAYRINAIGEESRELEKREKRERKKGFWCRNRIGEENKWESSLCLE